MDDDPTKTAARALREHREGIDRAEAARREAAAHETAHVGVGIMEGMMSAKHVADPYGGLHRADEIAAVVLKVVTVIALTFGLFEYDRRLADERVAQSLGLVEEWESGAYHDAYTAINDVLFVQFKASEQDIADAKGDPTGLKILYGNLGETVTNRDDAFVSEIDRDVDKVFSFFERAAICADESICDYQVLKTFFGSESASFWGYFWKYAQRRQDDGFAGYGEWTRKFVEGDIRRAKVFGIF